MVILLLKYLYLIKQEEKTLMIYEYKKKMWKICMKKVLRSKIYGWLETVQFRIIIYIAWSSIPPWELITDLYKLTISKQMNVYYVHKVYSDIVFLHRSIWKLSDDGRKIGWSFQELLLIEIGGMITVGIIRECRRIT